MNSSKLTKVNALCFGLGKFETIDRGPISNSVYALLKMSLYCSYVFRTVTYSEVIKVQGTIRVTI